ncbi:MAG TPA: class I SAM-dependent methyltransferase [Candidatus Limnocylindria bacterium]|nr:class I SAM-dependent methyltransferase [Candidatus Limnocylindria bacterium]
MELGSTVARPLPSEAPGIRRVRNRDILPAVIRDTVARAVADPRGARARLLKRVWIELKSYSAPHIQSVSPSQIAGLDQIRVDGYVMRHSPLVLCALARLLACRTIFEIGTFRGDTSWLLAHNLPDARIFTLDLPGPGSAELARLEITDVDEYFHTWERGSRFRDTPEGLRITPLAGDSATFDFSPYRAEMDLVYIDASHSYSYVKADTEAALAMLSPTGTIVWDDYTYYPGIYAYLNELAPRLERPIYHLLGTRLAVHSRRGLLHDAE